MLLVSGSDYPKKVIPLIDGAKRNIDIVSYDWRWYRDQTGHPVQQFNIALVRAHQRGVQVRCVLNSGLLLPVFKKIGIQARILKDRRTLHTKMVIIDNTTLVIGSHNITRNAFGANLEASVIVEIPEGYTRVQEYFENLYLI